MSESNGLLKKAEEAGWIYNLQNTPLMVLRAPMTRLVTAIREILVKEVARPADFEEWIFPRMVPEEVLAKTGWLNNHREEAWLVDPKREFVFKPDEEGLFPQKDRFPSEPLPYALDPIQCVSLYFALFGKTLKQEDLPIKVFEHQGGWTHRYETAASGLTRGIEFLRLEMVWIALEQDAINIRNQRLKATVEAISDQLNLDVAIAGGDSCFEEPTPTGYGAGGILPVIQLPELYPQASVDILTTFQGSNDLEVATASRYDRLPRRFEIKALLADGSCVHPWSGCLGIGLTRLAAAFLEKHGFETDKWPKPVTRLFKEVGS
jgi:hypothetical protein